MTDHQSTENDIALSEAVAAYVAQAEHFGIPRCDFLCKGDDLSVEPLGFRHDDDNRWWMVLVVARPEPDWVFLKVMHIDGDLYDYNLHTVDEVAQDLGMDADFVLNSCRQTLVDALADAQPSS